MSPEDRIRLQHMLDAATEAAEFVRGKHRSDLAGERMRVLALLKALEIVGEAATKVTEETRLGVPGIPWCDVVGMRHRLVHGYFDVDLDVVWTTVSEDLPELIAALFAALDRAPD